MLLIALGGKLTMACHAPQRGLFALGGKLTMGLACRAATAQQLFHMFQSKRAALADQQQHSAAPAEAKVELDGEVEVSV